MAGAGVIEQFRVRVRRFQLIVGIGFFSAVLGSFLSASLLNRLGIRLDEIGWQWVRFVAHVALARLWVWAVLPACCYGVARVLDVRPWSLAGGAAATGELFFIALDLVFGGEISTSVVLARVVTFALGALLSVGAVREARKAVANAVERAQQAAEANKAQYADLLKESERIASKADSVSPADKASG